MRPPSSSLFAAGGPGRTLGLLGACIIVGACGWNPERPFEREAPQVNEAIGALDAGDAKAATGTLEDYLSTGACADGNIGAPDIVRRRPNGTFDLGLSLFRLGESYGRRFGDEELDAGVDEKTRAQRGAQIACALRVLGAIAGDELVPLELRARARYLEGNLNFLDGQYEDAVRAYDEALTLAPGELDGGDAVGRDAAWNRAIAQRRIEDKKDSGQDGAKDGASDGASDGGNDGAREGGGDSGGGGKDSGGGEDSGHDSGGDDAQKPPPPQPEAGAPPPPSESQDDRILEQLENAPTVQQEAAKKQAATRHPRRGMADK